MNFHFQIFVELLEYTRASTAKLTFSFNKDIFLVKVFGRRWYRRSWKAKVSEVYHLLLDDLGQVSVLDRILVSLF